jgi:tRNA G18 (ribose-2'-O)-methylase SpoU
MEIKRDSKRPQPARQPIQPQLKAGKTPAFALLDNIRSVWNVGSIFRTADAVSLAGLYLSGVTATPPRRDMEKTALGATLTVPWDYWENPVDAVIFLQEHGIEVIALEQTSAAVSYDRFTFPFPHCFVVGHEVKGVSPEVLARVDAVVDIPMAGMKQSLNVAVSFGVLAFEIRHQWLARSEVTSS